jgi:invasion protein IalB
MTQLRPFGALLALSLTLALPVFADNTTAGTGATATTTAPATQAGGDASLGTPAAAAPAPMPNQADATVGQTYLSQTFDSWELRCKKTADGADPCLLYQLLKDNTGNPVAEISFFALPDGQQAVAGANVIVPLETLLTRQLGITIDGTEPKVYPFVFCTRAGCVSKVGLVADELAALKKGAKAQVQIVPAVAPDKTVTLDVSLKGFTAGFEAVAKTLPPQ